MVARALNVKSEIGKQLDSLADMVSFGAVPGIFLFKMMSSTCTAPDACTLSYLPYIGFLVTLFSAARLALFNLDTRQSSSFIGLPTPANTIFIVSLYKV
jgi:CDP-diacylglycerol--serine O-phosphatidyltransferase